MSKQVLLVEDDAAIMETLSMFLNYEGYEVLRARSVAQAIEVLRIQSPDVVLLDYMLQDGTAEPVVVELRTLYEDRVKVILLTAADDPSGKGRTVGADAVVAKPFELDGLLATLRSCLDWGKQPWRLNQISTKPESVTNTVFLS
ncbi:MAG: response regulator [Bdellovibrionota bacterium]